MYSETKTTTTTMETTTKTLKLTKESIKSNAMAIGCHMAHMHSGKFYGYYKAALRASIETLASAGIEFAKLPEF